MEIKVNAENAKFFEALGSETRLKIVEILSQSSKNIGELAALLDVSSAIITRHISLLESVGIVTCESLRGIRGIQKRCSLAVDFVSLDFQTSKTATDAESDTKLKIHSISIPIGQYSQYKVEPTCGLASTQRLIGICDDPRYFSSPEHFDAAILWFHTGFVEYVIPSYIFSSSSLQSIEISLEICSEFPGYNEHWPSDIYFYVNDVLLGIWTCPGDFGEKKGALTPDWWRMGTQYGLLKTLRTTQEGTMLDGIVFSNTTLKDIRIQNNKDIVLKIAVPDNGDKAGGMNLFGKGFGNYDQDIIIRVEGS